MSQLIGVGVLLNQRNEVLIAQRLPGDLLGNLWEFPGGKQELGETIEECIVRELHEEVGLEVVVEEHLIDLDHTYDHRQLSFSVHLCRHISGEPKPIASRQVRWIMIADLVAYPFPRASLHMIDALHMRIARRRDTGSQIV